MCQHSGVGLGQDNGYHHQHQRCHLDSGDKCWRWLTQYWAINNQLEGVKTQLEVLNIWWIYSQEELSPAGDAHWALSCDTALRVLMVGCDNVTTRLIIPHTHRWRSQLASHSFISIRGSTMMPGRLMLQHEYSYLSLHHKPGPGVRGLRPAESESTLASSASWPAVASPCHLSHWGGNSAPASGAIRDQQTLSLLSSKYPEE